MSKDSTPIYDELLTQFPDVATPPAPAGASSRQREAAATAKADEESQAGR